MSEQKLKRPPQIFIKPERLKLPKAILLIMALVGILGSAAGFYMMENGKYHFTFGWLYGFYFSFTICMGCLFWVMLHHAVDANWSVVIRRIPETFARQFIVLALLFIPVYLNLDVLYKWVSIPHGKDVLLDWKSSYLNLTFLNVRFVFYAVVLVFLGTVLHFASRCQDAQIRAPGFTLLNRKLSYPGLFLGGVCLTFMAFDLLMALDHHWFSTMWGVYIFAGCAGSSMATIILISNLLVKTGHLKDIMTFEHNHIMGKLLLAFTIFWAYISFSQYMLIYYANIPEETIFFMNRNAGTWFYVSVALVFGRFFIPFFLLLTQPAKKDGRRLCFTAVWILIFHAIDYYWIIMPAKQYKMGEITGFAPHLLDFLPLIGIAGVIGYCFVDLLGKYSVVPNGDPRLYESMTLQN